MSENAKKGLLVSLLLILGVLFLTAFFLFYFGVLAIDESKTSLFDAGVFYFALLFFNLWAFYLFYRMREKRTTLLFFWIAFLSEIWLYSGFLKRFTIDSSLSEELLWYFAYGPLLFMPGIWLCLVLNDLTKINVRHLLWGLDAVAGVLFLLLMSNSLHHWAFRFVYDQNGAYQGYTHGPLYYVAVSYIFLLLALSVFFLIKKTFRKRNALLDLAFLALPVLLLASYSICYLLKLDWLRQTPILKNYYVMDALFVFALMESALRSGLVQNSGNYHSYFTKGPYRLALAYKDYSLYERSEGFVMSPLIEKDDDVVVGDYRYRKEKIAGGYLLYQDDIADVLHLQSELLAKQAELSKTTAYLAQKEKLEQELLRWQERCKLNATLLQEIEQEKGTIERLVTSLPDTLKPEERSSYEPILLELQNRLAFLKQRCLFLVNASNEGELSYEDFALSEGSLLRDLTNSGFNVALSYPSFSAIPLKEGLKVNAFFRALIRSFKAERGDLFLTFDPVSFRISARILSKAKLDFSSLPYSPKIEEEEGEYLVRTEGRI